MMMKNANSAMAPTSNALEKIAKMSTPMERTSQINDTKKRISLFSFFTFASDSDINVDNLMVYIYYIVKGLP